MKNLRIVIWIVSVILFQFYAYADGIIIIEDIVPPEPHIRPRPAPRPEPLPIKYHRVNVDIVSQVATTHIDQVFLNPYPRIMEGTYIFPLPEEAAISEFALYMDGQKVQGEILEKDEARRIYEDIVRRMRDPGLLEYMGRNLFKARVFPIPANGEKRIELTYHQTLKYDAGMIQYRYPLNTERFSPRPLEEVALSVKIKSKVPIKNVYSPSHEVDVKMDQYEAVCGFEQKNVRPDKDFILYYHVSEKEVGLNLLSFRKRPSEDGYFMLLVSPGETDTPAMPKDIVFVLDASGSMQGGKLDQAKNALRFCIQGLNKEDLFNVISFATSLNPFAQNLLEANKENVGEALKFVDGFKERGGTDINSALLKALAMFPDSKRPRMVVFLTDGEPTIGVTNSGDILKNLQEANKAKARIFVFGVGHEVNTHLLDKIAENHRGVPEYVTPKENIEVKVSSFYEKVSEPVLADVEIDLGKIKIYDMYPQVLPDLFKGSQLILTGRYREEGATAIKLAGYMNGEKKEFVYEEKFPEKEAENDFIPRLWATRKVGYLLSEIRFRGENRELVDEVIRLSKEYGIITPYTSFLVLEPDQDRFLAGTPAPGRPRDESGAFKSGMAMPQQAQREMVQSVRKMQSGEEAVMGARTIQELKKADVAGSTDRDSIKYIEDKTFYLQNGFWVDSEYKEDMKLREIKYLSEEYFNLLKEKPGLQKYFSRAEKIILVFDGECYKIVE